MKRNIWLIYTILLLAAVCITGSSFLSGNFDTEEAVEINHQEGDWQNRQIGRNYPLNRGVYQVTVDYEAGISNNYIFAASEKNPEKTGCDRLLLERGKKQETFLVWISGKVEDFAVLSEYRGVETFSISRIRIQETNLGRWHDLFCVLTAGLVLFGVLKLVMTENPLKRKRLAVSGCLVLITLLSSIPLYSRGVYVGHDSGFHFNRIEGVWQGLLSGQFPVRIQPNWLHGYGYAVSICYGDILLYIPGFLRLIGFSVQEAYEWFVFLVNGAAAVVSYYCWKKMFGQEKTALLGSFLYTLSIYRLANVYTRAAVGEYCAMIFLPVVVYGFWCILGKEGEKKNWIPLMLGFSGLLQTHILSCEITGLFSIFLCLILIRRVLKKENLLALIKAAAGTLCINAWFLVPFLEYMLRERLQINQVVLAGEAIQELGAGAEQIFRVFAHGTGIPMMLEGWGQERFPFAVGLSLQFGMLLICWVWFKYRKKNPQAGQAGFLLLLAGVSIIAASRYFPWDILIASGLGFLASIQFPWRFLGIATVLLCTGCCGAFGVLAEEMKGKTWIVRSCIMCLLAASVVSAGYMAVTYLDTAERIEDYEQRDAPYYVSNGEYLPSDIVYSEDAFHPLEPIAADIEIDYFEKDYNRVIMNCRNLLDGENVVRVPILLYRGYRAYDTATGENFSMLRSEDGTTGIVLPGGYQGQICMEFEKSYLWLMGEFLSLAAILFLYLNKRNLLKRIKQRIKIQKTDSEKI